MRDQCNCLLQLMHAAVQLGRQGSADRPHILVLQLCEGGTLAERAVWFGQVGEGANFSLCCLIYDCSVSEKGGSRVAVQRNMTECQSEKVNICIWHLFLVCRQTSVSLLSPVCPGPTSQE